MIESLRNIFAIPDLRKRLMFTFALLGVYRVGCLIPTPGVNPRVLSGLIESAQGTMFGFLNTFTGQALANAAVFSLGIMPYITASIILQLLTVVIPYLEKLSKEGELGKRKITQYTRYLTLVVSGVQSTGIALSIQNITGPGGERLVPDPGVAFVLMTVLTLTTGCAFVMWLGEQISERGIGNGISLIIFAGIVIGLPGAVFGTAQGVLSGTSTLKPLGAILLIPFMLAVTAFIVYMERSQRRVPVQYAKRVVGRKIYGGQNTYLPLRVNTGGVIPVIFASSILVVPITLGSLLGERFPIIQSAADAVAWGQPLHYLLYALAIIFFSYFYVSIIFNPQDTAENMRKYGGFIPGIRSGRRTAEYLDNILTRLTAIGSVYLTVVSILPELLINGIKIGWLEANLPDTLRWITDGMGINFYFGGTSLLIVVGVAMDFVQQVESQLVMRNYDGFLKKGRIRGRR